MRYEPSYAAPPDFRDALSDTSMAKKLYTEDFSGVRDKAAERFLREVAEAKENGYSLVCVECGTGIEDGSEEHGRGCSRG